MRGERFLSRDIFQDKIFVAEKENASSQLLQFANRFVLQ
jgi:hypothetical protein